MTILIPLHIYIYISHMNITTETKNFTHKPIKQNQKFPTWTSQPKTNISYMNTSTETKTLPPEYINRNKKHITRTQRFPTWTYEPKPQISHMIICIMMKVNASILNCKIVVCEFERCCVHFRTNTFRIDKNSSFISILKVIFQLWVK